MVKLVPTTESDNNFVDITSSPKYGPDLFDCIYTINENYYKTLFGYTKESILLEDGSKNIFKKIADWILPEGKKFENQTIKINNYMDQEIKTIERYIEKSKISDSVSTVFSSNSYLVNDIIKIFIPSLPKDMATSLDKLDQVKLAINDPKLYKRMNTKLYFIGQLPLWFTKYRTIESMSSYLYDNAPTFLYDGFMKVSDLLPKLKEFRSTGAKYYSQLVANIQQEKRKLDILTDRISVEKQKMIKSNKQDKAKIESLFNMYETNIELVYMQISVYHRAIMLIYGKCLTELGDVVRTIYDSIDNSSVKKYKFADRINIATDF